MARAATDVFRLVGTTVSGAFQVEAVVAEGGFAVVYRAHHAGFRAPVALKCLKIPQYLSAEDQLRFQDQFQAEAELLFKLSASIPTVVRPLHVEAVVAPDGSFMPFLALEWLEGETLDSIVQRRRESGWPPFTLEEVVGLLEPVAVALDRAHHFEDAGGPVSIVHRDMKPENIFVASVAGENVVKILDFGIGKAKSVASQVAGRMSQNEGELSSFTPAYGAPEQWSPKRYGQTGTWTDVWGLALTMVELLAGRPIIDGDHAAMMGTVLDPVRRPSPRVEGVEVGDGVEAVFQRALSVDPRTRFRDAGEFWRALLGAQSSDQHGDGWPRASATHEQSAGLEFDLGELSASAVTDTAATPWSPSIELTTREPPPPVIAKLTNLPGSTTARTDWEASLEALRGSAPPAARRGPLFPSTFTRGVDAAWKRFLVPLVLVILGVILTVTDGAYAARNGQVFSLGPIRLAWCAAVAVLAGIGLATHRFFSEKSD